MAMKPSIGKKAGTQVGGNTHNTSSPNKTKQVGGNSPSSGTMPHTFTGGNHVQGAKYKR